MVTPPLSAVLRRTSSRSRRRRDNRLVRKRVARLRRNLGDSPASPFKSITRATLAAAAGDTVHVAAGLYGTATTNEVFPIRMFDGVLQGAGSASVTILGNGVAPVMQATGLGSSAKIDGFTITGGSPGLDFTDSALTISNNVVSGNTEDDTGGGIHSVSGDVQIIDN